MWQTLYERLEGLVVIAVAMDNQPDAARPWIEKASPGYPCPIDQNHHLADLYNMVNVPQAVWIDEEGQIVRPTEVAGAFEGFRQMDRATFQMPEQAMTTSQEARKTYLAAIADWVEKGASSAFAYSREEARARTRLPDAKTALANAHLHLGLYLQGKGKEQEGRALVEEAIRLRPESWNFWRQNADPSVMGLAAGPEFWERVDALGEGRYYASVDMKGMP